jgi:type IV secretion system protein VirB10
MADQYEDEQLLQEPQRPRPTRLNRRVVLAAGAVLISVVGTAFALGFQAPSPLVKEELEDDGEKPNLLRSEVMQGAPRVDYSTLTKPAEKPEPVVIEMPPEIEAPEKLQPAALPGPALRPVLQHQQQVTVATSPTEDPDAAARRKQLAQEREAALKSSLFANRQTAASSSATTEGQGSLFDGAAVEGASPAAVADQRALTPVDQNLQGDKRRFAETQASDGVYVQKPYLRPLSPFEVKAGTIIPGALVTGLNSDLPGEIIGRITENVYDTVSGRHVLIPQGTTVVGRYNSFVAYGQDRAQIVWDRLIMPNGRSIELEGMRGADKAGASGLEDEVDHHWGRVIGAVILSTGISVVSNIATDDSSEGSLSDELGSAVAQESAQVGSDFVRRNSNIQPTIKVRPGWPFTIIVHKDLVLDPAS